MSTPHTPLPTPVPIPIRGLNRRDPLDRTPPEYSPWLLNWDPESQYLRVRNGYVVHCVIGSGDESVALMNYQDTKLFAWQWFFIGDNKRYDVTTSTPSSAVTMTDSTETDAHVLHFGGLSAFTTADDMDVSSQEYDGSSWSAFGFGDAATASVMHKGRVYMGNDGVIKYGGLLAVTGSTTTWTVTSLFEQDDDIYWMETISTSTNNSNEQFLVFGNKFGEVLAYAGDNPGAANWEQVARFEIPKPLGFEAAQVVGSDILVLTEGGIVSIRKKLADQEGVLENTLVSAYITPYWTELMRAIAENEAAGLLAAEASMTYWPEREKLYVLVNGFVAEDGTYTAKGTAATMFVYNIVSKAWCVQKLVRPVAPTYGCTSLTYFNNGIYFSSGDEIFTLSDTVYKDEEHNSASLFGDYDVELHSAYMNYQNNHKYKKVEGFDALIKTDFGANKVGMQAAADFGRKVSSTSYQPFTDGYNNPFYSVGVEGNYIQYRIDGAVDTDSTNGLELYSIGVALK